jgi:hypothetical protein
MFAMASCLKFQSVIASAAKQSTSPLAAPWIASRQRGAHSRDPLARNDDADRDCSIQVS